MEKNREAPLSFVPVTEGLGFHPFSDGLPYAPVSKTQTTPAAHPAGAPGAGAVAAGRPTFAFPQTTQRAAPLTPAAGVPIAGARVSVPVAPQLISPPVAGPARVQAKPAAPSSPRTIAPAAATPTPEALVATERPGFIYLFKRLIAYGFDMLFNLSIFVGFLFAWQAWDPHGLARALNPVSVEVLAACGLILHWAMLLMMEVIFLSSPGKKLMGLKLQGSRSAAFLRAFFFVPSVAFAGLGVVWAVLDRRKRCWHDHVVDAQPFEVARL